MDTIKVFLGKASELPLNSDDINTYSSSLGRFHIAIHMMLLYNTLGKELLSFAVEAHKAQLKSLVDSNLYIESQIQFLTEFQKILK